VRQLSGHPIAVRALERGFGPRQVLSDVSLTVAAGEVHGVLGPAAAGKSTLLRVLAGQIGATAGDARVLGHRPGAPALDGRVAFVEAGDDSSYQRISGLENLVFFGRLRGLSQHEAYARAEAVLHETGLTAAAHGPVGEWTPAMRRRLAYARALLTDPAVLLIDAPAEVPEPEAPREHVTGRARRGAAVVWAARRLDELAGAARTVTLLADGRVRYAGTVSALADRSTGGWGCADAA
jgi:ABC-type multidrug transport system ATPase subunit